MAREHPVGDRIDFIMGILAFAGVGIAVLIPSALILSSIFLPVHNLEFAIIACQVGGCVITGVALGYFICRKEM
ncbi:MAG: hypothetical protein ACXADB_07485 [Candidatus Hermodarchaeia archaeon]|jgi:hypothetical protein